MNELQMALLEKLIDTNKELIEAMNSVADSQYLIAQALAPTAVIELMANDGPGTLQ